MGVVFIVIQAPNSGWLLENRHSKPSFGGEERKREIGGLFKYTSSSLTKIIVVGTKIIAISKCSHPLTVGTKCDHPWLPCDWNVAMFIE